MIEVGSWFRRGGEVAALQKFCVLLSRTPQNIFIFPIMIIRCRHRPSRFEENVQCVLVQYRQFPRTNFCFLSNALRRSLGGTHPNYFPSPTGRTPGTPEGRQVESKDGYNISFPLYDHQAGCSTVHLTFTTGSFGAYTLRRESRSTQQQQ